MKISHQDWDRVVAKACDIANATASEDDPMYDVHVQGMMALLDDLEEEYGPQSRILATRADYLEDISDRRALYERALHLAKTAHDEKEIGEIMDSLSRLGKEQGAEPNASR